MVALVWVCFQAASVQAPYARLLLPALIAAAAALATLAARAHKSLRAAELIIENQILQIRPVLTDTEGCGQAAEPPAGMQVFISCFGILVGSEIITFNQGGAQLKAVEIGCDSISFVYGMGERIQKTHLLRPAIDSEELAGIVERFRYETGVIPTIITG